MNLATLFVALIVTSAAEPTGDPVLLDFQATWCGPCQEMRPAVEKLVSLGYPVKQIDIDRSPRMAERYRVEAVPTFVVVDAQGNELARTKGVMSPKDLAVFYNETKLRAAASAPAPADDDRPRAVPVAYDEDSDRPSDSAVANPNPWQTVVRITMHLSKNEWGYGSGTIIYSSAEESIILTCAHIFRVKGQRQPEPANFRVPITVDLFSSDFIRRKPDAMLACTQRDIVGEAIDYDFTNDVGLIRIRPGRKLASSRVVPASWRPEQGMPMTTVGCSHGEDATAWSTKILSPRVGMSNTETKKGFATIKCAFQPKEGRSGGGLYTADGYVAGVCDFADPNEKVGLYAVPEAIHRLLDRNQLTALYKAPNRASDALLAANQAKVKTPNSAGTKYRGQNPEDITLPSPSLVGIKNPPGDGRAWKTRGDDVPASRAARKASQVEIAQSEPVDEGARPGEARTTERAVDPGPEARALEDPETLPPVAEPDPKPATNPTRSRSSGWKPVRSNPAEAPAPRPVSR